MEKLLGIKEVASILNVTKQTLRNWDKGARLTPIKTVGGHRRYKESDIKKFLNEVEAEVPKNQQRVATYSRVSSHEQKQKGDLERQHNRLVEYCAKNGYLLHKSYSEVGSGMSDNRSKMLQLFNLVKNREINKVVVENKDRLTRFQFQVFICYFESHGVTVEVVENRIDGTYEQELVDDIMSLMASFSGKLYGQRSAERRKKMKLERMQK